MRPFAFAFAVALLAACGAAEAGRSCEERPTTLSTLTRGLAIAERTHGALEAEHARSGARIVVLARAGQDLGKYGLRYSHLGFAYRDGVQDRPVWRVLHKLNGCGSASADLYRHGLGEFFLDDPWRYEAAWVVLRADLQQALLPVLMDTQRAQALHQPAYSMVAYPWAQRYQQSNQWALETLAASQLQEPASRAAAQRWLAGQDYRPTTLRLGPLTRLGGRMTAANIAFDDHPNDKRFSDRIETVTVDSVFDWLRRTGIGGVVQTVNLD